MIFEDERLHNCPKPWFSESNRVISLGLAFGIASFIFAALFFLAGLRNESAEQSSIIVYTGFFLFLGLVFILVGIRASIDHKDKWNMNLPYNTHLYDLLDQKITVMLNQENINFSENRNFSFEHVVKDKDTGHPLGATYKIHIKPGESFDFEYALALVRIKSSVYYNLKLTLINVKTSNLEDARSFRRKIDVILETLEYKKFKEVREI